jgi:hypothetical protein
VSARTRTDDEQEILRTVREAARHAARAAADLATFADRLSPVLDAAQRAEYAALLARDDETRQDRQSAFDRLGLAIPSVEEQS